MAVEQFNSPRNVPSAIQVQLGTQALPAINDVTRTCNTDWSEWYPFDGGTPYEVLRDVVPLFLGCCRPPQLTDGTPIYEVSNRRNPRV